MHKEVYNNDAKGIHNDISTSRKTLHPGQHSPLRQRHKISISGVQRLLLSVLFKFVRIVLLHIRRDISEDEGDY
jgi:hypothetical protein